MPVEDMWQDLSGLRIDILVNEGQSLWIFLVTQTQFFHYKYLFWIFKYLLNILDINAYPQNQKKRAKAHEY